MLYEAFDQDRGLETLKTIHSHKDETRSNDLFASLYRM